MSENKEQEEKRYYLVTVCFPTTQGTMFANQVTDKHPVEWAYANMGDGTLVSAWELSHEQYSLFRDKAVKMKAKPIIHNAKGGIN